MAGYNIRDNISGLSKPRRGQKIPKKNKSQGTLVPRAGVGKPSITGSGSAAAGGGIASPLTEVDNSRTYYTTVREYKSSDGIFVIEYHNIKTINMTDAKQAPVQFVYKDVTPS